MNKTYFKETEPVVCVNTKTHYANIYEAHRDTECRNDNILRCCEGKAFTTNGLTWVWERNYYEGMNPRFESRHVKSVRRQHERRKRGISPFCVECVETKARFKSVGQAYNYATTTLGIITTSMGISMCIRGKKKETQGYHWRRIDNE